MLTSIIAAVVVALLGAAALLYGYRLFLIMLPVWGFFAGFWLGAATMTALFGDGFLATTTSWVVGFIAGLVFAVLTYLFYALAIAILAAVLGASLGAAIMTGIGFQPGLLVTVVAGVCAILVVALIFIFNLQKYVVIVLTAVLGADLLVLALLLLFGQVTISEMQNMRSVVAPVLAESWLIWIVWLVLGIISIVFQVRSNREFAFSRDKYVEAWG